METNSRTARLHFQVDGAANGPAVVFGPSLGTDLGLFAPQVPALAATYRLVRHDLRGHGLSEVPAAPYTIEAMAGDVVALMDSLGVRRFSYVGVSVGGAIGLWLGLKHPERVDGLVICSSAVRFADPPSYARRAARVREEGTEFLVESRTGAWFTPGFAQRCPEEAAHLLGMLRTTPRDGYAGTCEAIATFDLRDSVDEIEAPTLVIAGEKDPATPVEMVREIADGIPGSHFTVVPDTSHLLTFESPDVVNRAIAAHLGRIYG